MRRTNPRRRSTASAALLLTCILIIGLAPAAASATAAGQTTMYELTNRSRTQHHRDPLDLNARLSRIATRHSRKMAKQGDIFHSDNITAILRPYDWTSWGENVGMGPDLSTLERAFMHSPEHRENILRRTFENVAVGVADSDGTYFVTVIFYG